MADLIFHHYQNSPFSEKVRLIFGYKKLAWKSVFIPPIMPKPNLTALTGGYRRTPVLQIGADIYCDTALIADVLERIAPEPSLYPAQVAGVARTVAQWADSTLFWTVIAYVFQPAAMPYLLGPLTPEQMKAFGADRAAMRGNAPRMSVQEATGNLRDYLSRLENMLEGGNPYLLGAQASIADFSVYHSIWFLQLAHPLAGILDAAAKQSRPSCCDGQAQGLGGKNDRDRPRRAGKAARRIRGGNCLRRNSSTNGKPAFCRHPRHRAGGTRDDHADRLCAGSR